MARFHVASALAAGAFLLTSLACFVGGGPPLPEPEDCRNPTEDAQITSLELGAGAPFEPFGVQSEAPIEIGGQGTPMLMVRLRINAGGPDCLAQQIRVLDAEGVEIGVEFVPLQTTPEGNHRVTADVPVRLAGYPLPGDRLTVLAEALGHAAEHTLIVPGTPEDTGTPPTGSTGDTGP